MDTKSIENYIKYYDWRKLKVSDVLNDVLLVCETKLSQFSFMWLGNKFIDILYSSDNWFSFLLSFE